MSGKYNRTITDPWLQGATRLFGLPHRPEHKRGKAESVTSPLKLRPAEPLYLAGQDLDFSWYEWQVEALIEDYNAGVPVMDIAERLNRDYREVSFLVMELAHNGRLKPRGTGVFGV